MYSVYYIDPQTRDSWFAREHSSFADAYDTAVLFATDGCIASIRDTQGMRLIVHSDGTIEFDDPREL